MILLFTCWNEKIIFKRIQLTLKIEFFQYLKGQKELEEVLIKKYLNASYLWANVYLFWTGQSWASQLWTPYSVNLVNFIWIGINGKSNYRSKNIRAKFIFIWTLKMARYGMARYGMACYGKFYARNNSETFLIHI